MYAPSHTSPSCKGSLSSRASPDGSASLKPKPVVASSDSACPVVLASPSSPSHAGNLDTPIWVFDSATSSLRIELVGKPGPPSQNVGFELCAFALLKALNQWYPLSTPENDPLNPNFLACQDFIHCLALCLCCPSILKPSALGDERIPDIVSRNPMPSSSLPSNTLVSMPRHQLFKSPANVVAMIVFTFKEVSGGDSQAANRPDQGLLLETLRYGLDLVEALRHGSLKHLVPAIAQVFRDYWQDTAGAAALLGESLKRNTTDLQSEDSHSPASKRLKALSSGPDGRPTQASSLSGQDTAHRGTTAAAHSGTPALEGDSLANAQQLGHEYHSMLVERNLLRAENTDLRQKVEQLQEIIKHFQNRDAGILASVSINETANTSSFQDKCHRVGGSIAVDCENDQSKFVQQIAQLKKQVALEHERRTKLEREVMLLKKKIAELLRSSQSLRRVTVGKENPAALSGELPVYFEDRSFDSTMAVASSDSEYIQSLAPSIPIKVDPGVGRLKASARQDNAVYRAKLTSLETRLKQLETHVWVIESENALLRSGSEQDKVLIRRLCHDLQKQATAA
ncbi:uncharacterized protein BJ171DRAFT_491599 [Polychytrium aggregatum]|uniref:uncharacterized protein n=1 Tax=Polychytrium aggregatum TaxID=110093 RepID=UPI0022FE2DAE|nr:uncharacterized protein BJ171DRAFT_491599 [Polychytrium aggregatum]KAI9207818.1 hypothetical protein BJ171DRAFT_491599 [Polychytrium aggregatum]